MPIKYGELTIIHNKEELDIFTSFSLWLGNEVTAKKQSEFIFLFEDGEITHANSTLKDLKFKFLNSSIYKLPIYFEKNTENKNKYQSTYFYKTPLKIDNLEKLDFKPLFSSYSKFNASMNIASYYNSIYYFHKSSEKPEIFGIVRIKSSEIMPRFQFAYDNDEFSKEEVVYLINYMFTCNRYA